MKALALVAACLALSACASPFVAPTPGKQPSACAALLVRALTSPNVKVRGSFACQDAALQARAKADQVTNDAGIELIAGFDPVFSHPFYIGQMPDGGYEYGATATTAGKAVKAHIFVWTDPDGKVSNVGLV